MRKFELTSPRFVGVIEVLYDFEGHLCRIDMVNATLTPQQRNFLIDKLPLFVTDIHSIKNIGLGIQEVEFNPTVDEFLHVYPYKRNTHLVRDYWPKMSRREQIQAYLSAPEYARYCDREKKWYKPKIAASWLKEKEYVNNWKSL